MITVYHNPRCSKSRECLALPEFQGIELNVIEYLKTPPTKEELKDLLKKLGIKPLQLVRTKEQAWQPYKDKKLTPSQIISLLAKHPQLIERPIVVHGDKAVIARPASAVKTIL